jgi:hypothetical protein
MQEIKGLIIDMPHIDNILSGRKIWEMRSSLTKIRGMVALIRKGSGQVIGVAELTDSIGPFSTDEMLANQPKHMISTTRLADPKVSKWNKAWVMKNARLLQRPVPYNHPNGAVIWVNLEPAVLAAVRTQL